MTEIKKLTKIVLIVYAIIFFIFGVNLTFLYDVIMNPEGWTSTLIIEISVLSILGSTFGASTIQLGSSTIILEAILLTLGIVVYVKQRS
ncbi:MAG: hypothetical protein ACW990_11885 [Promethearchaeota archaeon]|jgi:hypothetical protein